MKRIILFLGLMAAALCSMAQSQALTDIVRANTLSPARVANAMEVMEPYTATGTDTYSVTIMSGVLYAGSATYVTGDLFTVTFTNANTSTTVTLNVNTEGAIAVKDNGGSDPGVGDIVAGGTYLLRYNGTNFRIVGATGGGGGTPGGSDTQVQFNDASAFGGDAGMVYNKTTNRLTVDSVRVIDEAYGSGWNADTNVPTKNAIYDFLVKYTIDQDTPSTAGSTITLDMNSQIQRSHVGSASFSTPKTLALSNTTNSLFFNFFFEVTDVAAVLTWPSDWISSNVDFNGTTWTPPSTGKYEFGGSFNDTSNEWYIKIDGDSN